jgi:hypothetical protein
MWMPASGAFKGRVAKPLRFAGQVTVSLQGSRLLGQIRRLPDRPPPSALIDRLAQLERVSLGHMPSGHARGGLNDGCATTPPLASSRRSALPLKVRGIAASVVVRVGFRPGGKSGSVGELTASGTCLLSP